MTSVKLGALVHFHLCSMFPMVNLKYPLWTLLVATAGAVIGCASMESPITDERLASDYQTGSNLPKKSRTERVQTLDPQSVQQTLPTVTGPSGRAGAP
jgi:hypothetical protein